MPVHTVKTKKGYVVKEVGRPGPGKKSRTHSTKAKAQAQARAINASLRKSGKI